VLIREKTRMQREFRQADYSGADQPLMNAILRR